MAPNMTAPQKTSLVRLFNEEDIPQVAELHRTVFDLADHNSPELLDAYRTYFHDVFMNNPWRDPAVGPLVHQDPTGKITGFLGVTPRRLRFKDQAVQLAVMSQFIVSEEARGLPGMKLLSALFAGPQDLTIADEASTPVRVMWEGLGGHTSIAHSMRWFYALRPSQFGLMVLKKLDRLPAFGLRFAAPMARAMDTLCARFLKFPYRPEEPYLKGEEMTAENLLSCLAGLGGKDWLKPDYDASTMDWTLRRAAHLRRSGDFKQVLVRSENGKVAGWYLYYLNHHGVSQVLQVHSPAFCNQSCGSSPVQRVPRRRNGFKRTAGIRTAPDANVFREAFCFSLRPRMDVVPFPQTRTD